MKSKNSPLEIYSIAIATTFLDFPDFFVYLASVKKSYNSTRF